MTIYLKKIFRVFNFMMPFYYIAAGMLLFTALFDSISRNIRFMFSTVLIIYGIFRVYRAFEKT